MKILTTIAATALLSTAAYANNVSTDFFKSNGYTKPSISITEIQDKVNNGTFNNYPYVVGGGVEKGLFYKKLEEGTVIPQIKNVTALKTALDKKQVVLLADASGSVHACLPIFAEIAKQNGATCTDLMSHLTVNQAEGEDFFSNIDNVLADVDAKIDEITSELNDDVSEEVQAEVATAIEVEAAKLAELGVEVNEGVTEETLAEIYEETIDVIDADVRTEIEETIGTELSQEVLDSIATSVSEALDAGEIDLGAIFNDDGSVNYQNIADGINELGDLGHEITADQVEAAAIFTDVQG